MDNIVKGGDTMTQLTTTATIPQIITSLQNTVGTLTKKTGVVIIPSSVDIAITPGIFNGTLASGKVLGDANLIPSNILYPKTIFGVVGTAGISGSQEYTTPGTYSFTVPSGITSLFALFVAGGGGGGGGGAITNGLYGTGTFYSAGGGGGGQGITRITVTPGQIVSVVVGAGGAHGTDAACGTGWSSFGTSGFTGGNSSVGGAVATGGTGGGSERSTYQTTCAIGYGGAGMGYGSSGSTGTWANAGGTWGYNYGTFGGYGGAGSMGVGAGGNGAFGTGSAGQPGKAIILW